MAVMVTVPEAADADAETVRVVATGVAGLAVTELGFKEQPRPADPAQEKVTLPENDCCDVRLTVSVLVPPAATVSEAFPAEI